MAALEPARSGSIPTEEGARVKAVVLFSGGIASWAAARRTVERFSDVTLLFTDTLSEDEDLYRFLGEAAADVGAPLFKVSEGRTIWEVFRDEKFLGNSRVDPCSRVLKREQSRKWLVANRDPADTTVILGYDWTELHRLERAQAAWAPWRVEAPMTEPPYRLRAELMGDLEGRGIRPPRLYGLGFEHNNCGGGCVKAGQSHFAHLLQVFPSRFAEWEAHEAEMRVQLGDVAILRDRTGDESKPMPLSVLRERLEAGQAIPLWEIGGCACFEAPS